MIALELEYSLRHLRAGGGDCVGRSIARWSSFMHVSVYLEAEPPCQFPVFQTTHFGALALVRLLFHELLGPWTSTATATAMDLYRRARGVLPFVLTFIRTERVLSRTPLNIRAVDQ